MLSEQVENRLRQMVDRGANHNDPMYHLQLIMFREWLQRTMMAMEDEGVPPEQAERVANRLLYAHPDGASAYERIDRDKHILNELRNRPPRAMLGIDPVTGKPSL